MSRWLPLLLLVACPKPADEGDDTPTDDVDTDTQVPPLDCENAPDVPDTECLVQALSCGDVIEHTTVGGTTLYSRDTWADAQCLGYLLGDPGHLDGPERVYSLDVEPDTWATVTVSSPCMDIDLRVYPAGSECETDPVSCTAGSGSFQRREVDQIAGTGTGKRYEIVVDSYDDAAGRYRISVACSDSP